jgi:hypothetical protein
MKNSAKAILVYRSFGHIEVILFTNDEAFDEMCDFLETSNLGFTVADNVITCLGSPVKKQKLKAVKK